MPFKIIDKRRESWLIEAVYGRGSAGAITRAGLSALSLAYGAAQSRRTVALGQMARQKVDAKIISVGNITVGGTGKTPVCLYLAGLLSEKEVKTGVATRGYGRKGESPIILTRENYSASAGRPYERTGDEPLLYMRGGIDAVAVDADRYRGARELAESHGCAAVLLDDGFQFITLERDWNIAVMDAVSPIGNGRLIPRGTLREPVSALGRANLFWLTRADRAARGEVEKTREFLKNSFAGVPIVESSHEFAGFYLLRDENVTKTVTRDKTVSLDVPDEIKGKKVAALSAIGSPESFEQGVETLAGAQVLAYRFTDHHPFTTAELIAAESDARAEGCFSIVTTEKDEIRIPPDFTPVMPWYVLKIRIRVTAGSEHVQRIIDV